MIQDMKRQGLGVSAIARQTGLDRKTVRNYLARRLEAPECKRREPKARVIDEFANYLRERIAAFPELSAKRSGIHSAMGDQMSRHVPCPVPW